MDRPYDADCYRYSAQYLADNAHQIAIRFSRAIQMSPHDHYLTYQYALYLSENKNFTKSGEMFAKAMMINPEDDGIYIEWGNSTFLAGKYDQSAEIYQKLISIKPDMGQAHSNYGFILYSQEKFDEALGRFLKGAELDPRENIAHFNASLVLFHQGREKEGNGHFMNGLKATRTGKYTISSLIGIYNVQITHCEDKLKEEISQEQRSFLEAKLKGITRIVDLLKRENKIKQLIRNLSDYDNDDLEDPILIKYRDSLDNQLTNFFKKIFVFRDGVCDGYDNESLKLLDSKCKKVLACPDNKETEVIRVHPKFLEACTSEDQFIYCMYAIAKNTTMLKRADLLKANDKLGFINEIQEFIESKKSEDSIEEHAFLDCIVIARFLTANELAFEREDFNILEEIYVYLAFYFENALI